MNEDESAEAGPLRLAARIRQRRLALRLSEAEATRLAGFGSRNTWSTAEGGQRNLRSQNYAGIESALHWAPGSVEQILAGGEPTELPTPRVDVVRPPRKINLEVELAMVEALDQPAAVKYELVKALIRLAGQAQEEQADETQRGATQPAQ